MPLARLSRLSIALLFCFTLVLGACNVATAQTATAVEQTGKTAEEMVSSAVKFLEAAQAEDGSFTSYAGPGVTALVATAMMENGRTPEDPLVAKALAYVEATVQKDGGIYADGTLYRNYETCLAVMCFTAANKPEKYQTILDNAESFLRELQWDDTEGHNSGSPAYGGAGYGKHGRPDLSNTTFLVEAFRSLGAGAEDPAMQKALAFVSRCQNLETQHNTTEHAAKVNDGGFYYTAAAGGSSQAGITPNGGLRSYGSMSYAGLKSMIYAGLDKDDPRVRAAVEWISNNYTLEENPGMGTSGQFYYYHTFAKALDALGTDRLTTATGQQRNWRDDLISELAERQNDDGSWTNQDKRWLESDPNLVTAYCLLALSHCDE